MYIYVDIFELQQYETAPCNLFIYLPKNEKFVPYIKKGESTVRLNVLVEKQIQKIYIEFNFLNDFLKSRKTFTLDICNQFYSDYIKDPTNAVNHAQKYINTIFKAEEKINFFKLKTFTCNFITIINHDEYSKLYFALNHISPFEGVKHSQKASSLAISFAILKGTSKVSDFIHLAFASLMHETPIILSKNFSQLINQKRCLKYPMEFKKLYYDIGIPSKILEPLNNYHSKDTVNSEINELINKADTVVHKDIEKVEDILTMF